MKSAWRASLALVAHRLAQVLLEEGERRANCGLRCRWRGEIQGPVMRPACSIARSARSPARRVARSAASAAIALEHAAQFDHL
jgi:hypothetical protein